MAFRSKRELSTSELQELNINLRKDSLAYKVSDKVRISLPKTPEMVVRSIKLVAEPEILGGKSTGVIEYFLKYECSYINKHTEKLETDWLRGAILEKA